MIHRALLASSLLLFGGVALADDVTITTADGAALAGTTWGEGDKAVLLVADEGTARSSWDELGPSIAANGFLVLALDPRDFTTEADYLKLPADLAAATRWLTEQGATSVHAMGVGLGANGVLNATTDCPHLTDIVLVSTRPNIHGLKVSKAMQAYQGTVLFIAAEGSSTDARTATALAERTTGANHVLMLPGDTTGADNLAVDGVHLQLMSWLGGTFFDTQQSADGRVQHNLTTGDAAEVETSGTRYGEDH